MTYIFPRSDETKSSLESIENLVELPLLNEAELLQSVRLRFLRLEIFSYIGNTLLIVNPLEDIPKLFENSVLDGFRHHAKDPLFTLA